MAYAITADHGARLRVPITELYSYKLYTFVQTVLKIPYFSYLFYIPSSGIEGITADRYTGL